MQAALRLFRWLLVLGLLAGGLARADEPAGPAIDWQPWSPEVFARARREHKFVLLDLEAVWCHWCHVMDAKTYRDARVRTLLAGHYIAVRVDQDSRPDLANRYEDYGWPATVIYGPGGDERVKRRGYIDPQDMASLLQTVIDDPAPGPLAAPATRPTAATATALGATRRAALHQQWLAGYDGQAGGWGFSHKFLDADCVELALQEAAAGDTPAAARARTTLDRQRQLIDPVWGGAYQYSVGGDWHEPHFEKIMSIQADDLRSYARAYAQWGDAADLASARAIHHYLRTFLTSPDGVVYASQDADLVPGEHSADYFALDDAGRRARGIPRIDRHVYARENGWVIQALCALSAATGETSCRAEALRAATWVLAHRALPGGGFSHDEHDDAGPYLGDTLAMGRAFLALHQLTQDQAWLDRALAAAHYIETHFARKAAAGFASSDTTVAAFPAPWPQFDENVRLVRFATALALTSGQARWRELAADALRWLLVPGRTDDRGFYVAGLLLAEKEFRTDPIHITVVGGRKDPVAQALFATALKLPESHKLVERWDPQSGPPPRGEAIYPELDRAAVFLCANGACSTPIFTAAALQQRLQRELKPGAK